MLISNIFEKEGDIMKKYILVMLVLVLLVIVGCASEVDQHVEVVEEEQSDIEVVEEFFLDYQD